MDQTELIRLAFLSLTTNKLRSALTTLGVVIGVFAVILLVSIGTGLQSYITDQISGLGSNLIFVIPGRVGGARTPGGVQTNKLTLQQAEELDQKLNSRADVGPVIAKSATVKYKNKQNEAASVTGTTANYPSIVKTSIVQGAFFTQAQERSGAKVALIGNTVKDNLFGNDHPIGEKVTIDKVRYTVIGVLDKRGSVFGLDQDNIVVIPITAAQRQFGVTTVNAIYLAAKKPEYVEGVKADAKQILEKTLTEDDFTLQSQEQSLETVNNITGILTTALGGIAAISLLVGGIGVMNIMLVSVTERTREIGLRKALGAQRSDILKQFVLEAIILSLFGGTIGIILGIGVSLILAKFFISQVTAWSVILAFSFSVLVGVVFGLTPAIRASKLNPIEALRYE